MQAWVLEKNGPPEKAFVLRDWPKPEPAAGQVRIRVEAFGLNFADIMARKGMYPDCPPLPCVLGYDVVGWIDAVAPGVEAPPIGTRVVAMTRFGGYAEFAVTDARAVLPIPDSYGPVEATAMATQYGTAWYAARESIRLREGEKVLIHAAAGGVGTALVQLAKRAGCVIFGTAGSAEKRALLQAEGVHHPIDYRQDDWAEQIRAIAPDGLDAVFDAIGGKTFRQGLGLLAPGGRMVTFGAASLSDAPNSFVRLARGLSFGFYHPVQFLSPSKALIGVNMLRIADHKPNILADCFRGVGQGVQEGWLRPLSGGLFPASKLFDAHNALEQRQSRGKLACSWSV